MRVKISLLLVIILLFTTFSIHVNAADAFTLSVENEAYLMESNEVKVDIVIADNPGIASIGFQIVYDTETFIYTGYEVGEVFPSAELTVTDKATSILIDCTTTDGSNNTANGVAATLTFAVKGNVVTDTYAFDLDIESNAILFGAFNTDGNFLDVVTGNGSVELEGIEIKEEYDVYDTENNIETTNKEEVVSEKSDDEIYDEVDMEEPAVTDEIIVEETWKNPFIDVFESDSYYKAIEYVYVNGLFKGVSAIEFAPDTTMTRAMFVTVLGRLHGITEDYVGESVFEDVVKGEWYAPYVVWAADNGIVLGYGNGMFGINDKITIEQAAVILARYAAFIALETASEYNLAENYADAANVAAWAAEAMAWAVEEGIYAGADGYLYPQTPASRALIATMLYGFAY